MNIAKAVSWACRAWHVDVSPQNIQNCLGRSSWLEVPRKDPYPEEVRLGEVRQHLQNAVKTLERSSFIHEAMEINIFINPPFESFDKAWVDEEQIASQSSFGEIPEGDSDEELE
ncbi:hypothetical protein FE257_004959 [Aspergillus nanangensis]|uniref:Uncharacterized protein n=1 Tax=Aspergillus nanangensis TaxID=2582783 RepID=A0AAD4CAS6_ASPNN|nr:hypothetical protein FE257_004959 [Aspergillus nanangensis]